MLRFILVGFVLIFALNFSVYSQVNQIDLLKALLDIPAPPPSDTTDSEIATPKIKIPEDFYSKSKIPADNAPIEEIMRYWAHHNDKVNAMRYSVKPTDVVAQRIFLEIETKPEILITYLNILPPKKDYIEFAKRFYDENLATFRDAGANKTAPKPIDNVRDAIDAAEKQVDLIDTFDNYTSGYTLEQVKEWLTLNSKYYSDELEKKSNRIKDDDRSYVSNNKSEFLALARVDWEKAEPIIERLIEDDNQPGSRSLAMWAAYAHYMREEDESGASKYRRMLQEVVEDRKAKAGVRDLALDALVLEGDFEGRDDWYISLLEDETLYNLGSFTGLKTIINTSPPEYWIAKMLPLVGHDSKTVHNAVVRNLIIILGATTKENDKLIAKALMPWLSNRNWAKEDSGERSELIKTYARLNMPEAIPAVIQILQTEAPETESEVVYSSNSNSAMGKMRQGADKAKDAARKIAVNSMPTIVGDAAKDAKYGDSVEGLSGTQDAAIEALGDFKDSRAVPSLISALDKVSAFYDRRPIIDAIISCGGYGANQQLGYLEKIARKVANEESDLNVDEVYYSYDNETTDLGEQIGMALVNLDEPGENLVRLAIARLKVLRKDEPKVAKVFNMFLQKWESKVLDIERLSLVGNNIADLETILRVLVDRKDLVKKYPNQVASIRGSRGVGGGITACLFEDANNLMHLASGDDLNTRIAALACARLLRMKLPVNLVGQMLNNSNPTLALAAERYLISEDSFEARRMILSRYPNEARILGARHAFVPNNKKSFDELPIGELFTSVKSNRYYSARQVPELQKAQEKLRDEVKKNENLLGIYGFLNNGESGHKILRIFKEKAVYAWYEDNARYRERIVNKDELKLIFDYVASKGLEEMKPVLSGCNHGCPSSEFVMFGRNGGRRIYIYSYVFILPQPLRGMQSIFRALEQGGKSTLHYWLQDKIAGLEVILDEKNIKAKSLWKDGDDFRVLVLDEKRLNEIDTEISEQKSNARKSLTLDGFDDSDDYYQRSSEINKLFAKQRSERKFEPYAWRQVEGDKVSDRVSSPAENYFIKENGQFPEVDYLDNPESIWKARTPTFELRAGEYNKDGLWKVARSGLTTQIGKGNYSNLIIITADGKWAVVAKDAENYYLKDTYRINLQTGKEYQLSIPSSIAITPISYIESHNKFLVYAGGIDSLESIPPYILALMKERLESDKVKEFKSQYYLLDPNTGSLKPAKGEFAPFKQISFRNLQKTSNQDEFWAAIPNEKDNTSIGRYNSKTFKFTAVLEIPQIQLSSMDIWVDEKDSKIYFIYEGHLLSLPLKTGEQ